MYLSRIWRKFRNFFIVGSDSIGIQFILDDKSWKPIVLGKKAQDDLWLPKLLAFAFLRHFKDKRECRLKGRKQSNIIGKCFYKSWDLNAFEMHSTNFERGVQRPERLKIKNCWRGMPNDFSSGTGQSRF